MSTKFRRPLLFLPILALLAAMWAGLIRIGWQWPPIQPDLAASHGPLMISGFLGALISLERAVALAMFFQGTGKEKLLYLPAFLSGLGGISLILGLPISLSAGLITLGSIGLAGLFAFIVRRHPANFTAVMAAGAVCWVIGNGLWLGGRPVFQAVWWWAGFLILTIAGERLELSRLGKLTAVQQRYFIIAAGLFFLGLVAATWRYQAGVRLIGLGTLALAGWLARYDIARRTIKKTGQPRFAAACMLTAYFWLSLAGMLAVIFGGVPAGLKYDAMLHAIFLGFSFAMIFGHAPIIFPSVSGFQMKFTNRFYSHLILLNLTLALRIAGDLAVLPTLRAWGGLLNALVLLLFLANTIIAFRRPRPNVS